MLTLLLLAVPFVFGLIVHLLNERNARFAALFSTIISLGITSYLFATFDRESGMQFELNKVWVKDLGINFHLAMDGTSLILIALTSLISLLVVISTEQSKFSNPALFYTFVLLMQSALTGVFTSQDAFLFYVFWELALIPIYFICFLFGEEGRFRITLKFFAYTLAGSLLMLVGIIYLRSINPEQNFEISSFTKIVLNSSEQKWLFWLFLAAFAVKIPIFPLHTWQPDTYVNAPFQGTVLLGSVMSKMGIYGLIRFILPIFPDALNEYSGMLMFLVIFGIIYGSLMAWVQQDIKRLLAYSSFAHMGIMAAGVLSNTNVGVSGAVFQMFAHGVYSFGLFYIVYLLEDFKGNRVIGNFGGLRNIAPKLATVFLIILLGSVGLPLTNGFIGEFMILSGVFTYSPNAALFAGLSVILGAVYMLQFYQKTMLGNVAPDSFNDIKGKSFVLLGIVSLIIILTGVFPAILTGLL